ncbi:MAG: zinc ribbon domain-containing protein [Chloroflexi bacterium]|nr:zinc ribbon domain-containing protein [Chloroflexota bacterium]
MPLYEYYCRRCEGRFELLRPMGRLDDPAACPEGHEGGERVLSTFAAFAQGEGGASDALAGTGGCGGCAGGNCACSSVN